MTRAAPWLVALTALAAAAGADGGGGAGLPPYEPINPVTAARTGLGFEPLRERAPGTRIALGLDYASIIESPPSVPDYVLDAEAARLTVEVSRDLGAEAFVLARVPLTRTGPGVLDPLVDGYHRLLSVPFPEREARPRNRFLYQVPLPDGRVLVRPRQPLGLGDLRLGAGLRSGSGLQLLGTLTLPTTTAERSVYGRGTVALGLVGTLRRPLHRRLLSESSAGLGYTPRHGELAAIARTGLASLSSGLSFALLGRHSIYGNLFWHSPCYRASAVPALDRSELSLDLGWIGRTGGGREWRVGLVEDLRVSGPAVDLVLRFGLRF